MSEYITSNRPPDCLFGKDHWLGEPQPAPPADPVLTRSRVESKSCRAAAVTAHAYLYGQDGILLPDGFSFDPNNSPSNGWFAEEGTTIVFDWERLEIFPKSAEERPPEPQFNPGVVFLDGGTILAAARPFLLEGITFKIGANADLSRRYLTGNSYTSSAQYRREVGNQREVYERTVVIGVLQKVHGGLTCAELEWVMPFVGNIKQRSIKDRPVFARKHVPFEIGQIHQLETNKEEASGSLLVLERVKSVSILGFGENRRGKRKRLELTSELGAVVTRPVFGNG